MSGQIYGNVNRCEELPKKDGKEPIWAVEIETAGFLSRSPVDKGSLVTANFDVYWPKGGRPTRWLTDITKVKIVGQLVAEE